MFAIRKDLGIPKYIDVCFAFDRKSLDPAICNWFKNPLIFFQWQFKGFAKY